MTFDEYVAGNQAALLRFATVLSGDPFVAQDIVQEVLSRAYQVWPRVQEADFPHAYVRRMVVNEFLTWRRQRRRWVEQLALADEGGVQDDGTAGFDDRAELLQLIGRLPGRQRAAIVLRYYEGLNNGEIAEVMGCRRSTVRSNVARALASLRVEAGINHANDLCENYR